MMMDRYGPRGVLSLGALTMSIGSFLFCIANMVWIAFCGRILMGAGAAFAFVGCMNLIAMWFPARRFALMAGIVEAGGMIATIIGNFWLANAIEATGWRVAMFYAAIFAGIVAIALWLVVRDTSSHQRKKKLQLGKKL